MPVTRASTRAERERAAYDERGVAEVSERWLRRAIHVMECPNTRRAERRFEELLAGHARDGAVLDVGCGDGVMATRLHEMGARHVLGVDLSETEVAAAQAARSVPGEVEFRVADLAQPIEGTFDLVCGRSILHHIDYRPVVERLFEDNLRPGGALVFMEPLGSNLITRAFHGLVPSAHTPDEQPLTRAELRWWAEHFPGFELLPVNYLSYPVGLLSSLLIPTADNPLTRAADRIDRWIERRVPAIHHRFRQGVLVLRKPAA